MTTPFGRFDYERHALRWILKRLLAPNQDLATLCTYAPRLANAAVNVAKAEALLKSEKYNDQTDAIREALRELMDEPVPEEEEPKW